jgi:hypothetical protein
MVAGAGFELATFGLRVLRSVRGVSSFSLFFNTGTAGMR